MKDFKEFLFEEFGILVEERKTKDNLSQDSSKIQGHLMNYVDPFLSAEQREAAAKSSPVYAERYKKAKNQGEHGALHNPDPSATTHTTGSSYPGVPAGTNVKVTGIKQKIIDGKPKQFVTTQDHGDLPVTALLKPTSLKKPARTDKGFQVESQISDNLDWQAAGSTKHGHDYAYMPGHPKGIKGKVVTAGNPPLLKGESKLSRGKMGQSQLNWDSENGWRVSNEDLRKHFEKTKVVGPDGKERKLLDHLNTFHGNGIIDKGFSVQAPRGIARAYLASSGKNSLHVHNYDEKKGIDHGTTYTVGDNNPLEGRTGLGHIGDKELENFDGTINIEKTVSGKPGTTQLIHRPRETVMRSYANRSQEDPDNNMNLYDPEHAAKFKQTVKKLIKEHKE